MFLVIYCFHFVSSLNVCICFVTLNMGFDYRTQKTQETKRDQLISQSLIDFLQSQLKIVCFLILFMCTFVKFNFSLNQQLHILSHLSIQSFHLLIIRL